MKGDTDSAYSMAVMLLQGRGVPEKVRGSALHTHAQSPADLSATMRLCRTLSRLRSC